MEPGDPLVLADARELIVMRHSPADLARTRPEGFTEQTGLLVDSMVGVELAGLPDNSICVVAPIPSLGRAAHALKTGSELELPVWLDGLPVGGSSVGGSEDAEITITVISTEGNTSSSVVTVKV